MMENLMWLRLAVSRVLVWGERYREFTAGGTWGKPKSPSNRAREYRNRHSRARIWCPPSQPANLRGLCRQAEGSTAKGCQHSEARFGKPNLNQLLSGC